MKMDDEVIIMGLVRLSFPTFFLLMILIQNFIQINNNIKPEA